MNKIKAIAFGAIIFALLACEQPFKAGLGPVVDIRDPTLTLKSPAAGSYIFGEMTFTGSAEDDYILSKVEIKVTNRPDAEYPLGTKYLQEYTPVTLKKSRQNYGVWEFKLVTADEKVIVQDKPRKIFPEGDLKIKLKVTDSVGKWTETDEIVYQVKNDAPAISLMAPYIIRGENPGDVGGPHLNYFVDDDNNPQNPTVLPPYISYPRKVDKKSYLNGTINDDQGIYISSRLIYNDKGELVKFPPQYRIWEVGGSGFAPGSLPEESEVEWKAFDPQNQELFAVGGMGSYQFALELPDAPGNFYGFEIRASSTDEANTTFHYPCDYYDKSYFENTGNTPADWHKKENRFVLIYIKAPESTPSIEFYGLEDLFGEMAEEKKAYKMLDVVDPHPYVNQVKVDKNGSFTLRLRAIHQEGILRSEVYWQKEGTDERGRFIWDLANGAPPGSSSWNMNNTVREADPYSHWGYQDRIADATTRNFVFTYDKDINYLENRIPNTAHEQVRGQSKIQKFIGDDTAWAGRQNALVAWSYVDTTPSRWENLSTLDEGFYNIEVYATSTSLTGVNVPATRTVRLDWTPPDINLTRIDGEYGQADSVFPAHDPLGPDVNASVVNGVIRPLMTITEGRNNKDTGVRVDTNYGVPSKEQRFILVTQDDSDKMKSLASQENWWPPIVSSSDVLLQLTGTVDGTSISIDAIKHGPVGADNAFVFKTSPIGLPYNPSTTFPYTETDALKDGDYWLYVFARDNAFNVGHYSKKLVVRWKSDVPRFDLSLGNPSMELVSDPSISADATPGDSSPKEKGFWFMEGGRKVLRNELKANQEIKIKISDDDSLDLGTSTVTDLSGIKMWLSKSSQNTSGVVTEITPATQIDDAVVKQIFGTQSADWLPQKTKTGTIKQTQLPGNVDGRLPDGIYKLKITASDQIKAKERQGYSGTPPAPLVETESLEFWFMVNDNAPEFTPQLDGGDTTLIMPKAGNANFGMLCDTGISGTVSAVHGPITINYILTREGATDTIDRGTLSGADITASIINSKIQIAFTRELNIPGREDGIYMLRLTATDRFEKSTTVTQQYVIDDAGPVITLREPMQKVDRSNFDTESSKWLLGKNGLTGTGVSANLHQMANGVVSVTLRAVDPSGVDGLQYWLVHNDATLAVAWDWEPTDTAKYRYGTLPGTTDFNAAVVRINTVGLDTGIYKLYAMAVDEPGNYSANTTKELDTIYVYQDSDYPFFGDLKLDGKSVSKGGAVIDGTVYDDDGFQNAEKTGILPGSIKVWMSQDDDPPEYNAKGNVNDSLYTEALTGYTGPVTIPLTSLSSIGNAKNIGLNINLETHFSNMFILDGQKHYIIQATDSATMKFLVNGSSAPATTQVYRRLYYTFGYDNNPPKIGITKPGQNASIGADYSFGEDGLVGWMQDANLVRDSAAPNHYYFRYRLNEEPASASYKFTLTASEYETEIRNPVTDEVLAPDAKGETRVKFIIKSQARFKELLYQDSLKSAAEQDKLKQGENTLWLTAVDTSGKTASYSLKFNIDTDGPITYLGLKEVSLDSVSPSFNWLNASPNKPWYTERRDLLDAYDVPIIQRTEAAFYLNGTFRDEASYIDASFDYGFDGEAVTTRHGTIDAGASSKNASWQVKLNDLPDGLHYIQLRAYDEVDNYKDSKKFAFRINSGQPTVAFSTMPPSGTIVLGRMADQPTTATIFTISGTATSPNLRNVNLIIRHTGLVKTLAGYKPFEVNLVPGRAAGVPPTNDGKITNDWDFTTTPATALDPELPVGARNKVTENLEWSLDLTRANLNTAGNNNAALEEGTYEVAIVSTDMYGGSSDEAVWSFTIDKTEPRFTFSRLIERESATVTPVSLLATSLAEKTLQVAVPVVSARIQDTGSNLSTVQRQIRKWDYLQSRWEYYSFPATGTGTWTTTETWDTITGTFGQDYMVDWELKTTTGLENLEDGFYSIRYRAKDSARLNVATPTLYPDWNANTGNGSTSDGNPATSNYLYFFYANKLPELEHVNAANRTYSSANGSVSFSVTVNPPVVPAVANNRFHKLDVKVDSVNTDEASITVPTMYATNNGLSTGTYITTVSWTPIVNIPIPSTYKEGSYRVTFTVTDLAGRSRSINRVIYLDNNPPTGAITDPRFVGVINHTETGALLHSYASEIQNGGEAVIVNGTAQDVSGIKEIWFHLGYGHNNTTTRSFPTEAQIRTYWGNNPDEPNANSAWFKYDKSGQTYYNDNGTNRENFPYINFAGMDSSNPYRWSFTMTTTPVPFQNAVAYYASTNARVNGTDYNKANDTGPWMARPISTAGLPTAYSRSGLYSLPLYARIVDAAGNVFYTQKDIWIYPNGDYPDTAIINPSEDNSRTNPRGGQISVEGMANDNISVRTVIYRVFADNYTNNNEGFFDKVPPPGSALITDTIGPMSLEKYEEYEQVKGIYETSGAGALGEGWYVATPETKDNGQSVPWSFTLNSGGEFIPIIRSKGFNSVSLSSAIPANNNMVRLWIEMYVFDSNDQRSAAYNLMSLGDGDVGNPKPFVRVFYLKDSSPKIDMAKVSAQGNANTIDTNYELGKVVRRGQFAIQANLSGEGNPIDQISVRLPQEATSTGANVWRTAFSRTGGGDQNLPGITIERDTSGATYTGVTPTGYEKYIITYKFDAATSAASGFQRIMGGDWAASGGNYTIDIRIRDNGNPYGQDLYTMVIGVDNYAPFADRTTIITPKKVAGTNVAFMGRVFDYEGTPTSPTPPNRGIQQVSVWFTQGNGTINATSTLINPNLARGPTGNGNTMALGSNYRSAWVNRNANVNYVSETTTISSINFPTDGNNVPIDTGNWNTTIRYPANAAYVKVLNETTAGIMDNRITWQPTQNHDIYWSFIVDTYNNMPDGWITMHYLVEDNVGNASYYTQQMVVMNNYPQITDLVLFTNNTGTGAVFTTHTGDQAYSRYRVEKGGYGTGNNRGDGTYLNSGFISKNSVIGFGVNTQRTGTFPLHYQALYVQRYEIPLTNANLRAMATNRGGLATLSGVSFNGTSYDNVANFVNLYTIGDQDIGQTAWNTLGVRETTPAKGNHFMFQPSLDDVGDMVTEPTKPYMNYPTVYVYGYRQVFEPKAQLNRNADQVNQELQLGSDTVSLDVLPSDEPGNAPGRMLGLNYNNTGVSTDPVYFQHQATKPIPYTRINEFKGSQPGKANGALTDGTFNNANATAFFIIKVWDSVAPIVATGANAFASYEMLYDAVVIGMNVYLTDDIKPVARIYDLNPYTETAVSGNNINTTWQNTTKNNAAAPRGLGQNIRRGGLFNVKTERDLVKSGHIEPRNNTTALNAWYDQRNDGYWARLQPNGFVTGDLNTLTDGINDRVSGQVILRGKVWDNQLIDSISLQFGTETPTNPPLKILELRTSGNVTTMTPVVTGAYAVEELHWETGHTVEWAYIWNTESYTGNGGPANTAPRAGESIRLIATDRIGGSVSDSVTADTLPVSTTAPDTNAKFHNVLMVDIVPYVVGFERQSKFATTRSLQGWYSFYQNEADIDLLGYNLGTAGTAPGAAPTVQIRTSTTATTAITVAAPITNGNYPFTRRYRFSIPNDAISGKIEVTASGTAAYNHASINTGKSWNREYSSNISGSELWINKPYAHIWRTQQTTTAANDTSTPYTYFGSDQTTQSANLSSPSMALAYANENVTTSGSLHAAWSIYGTATVFYGSNDRSSRATLTSVILPTEPYVNPDISIFEGMYNGNGSAAASQHTANVVVAYQSDGTPSVRLRTQMVNGTGTGNADNAFTRISDESDGPTQRWRNQRIAKAAANNANTNANTGRVYMTSYDSYYGNLWLGSIYGAVATNNNRTRYIVDGTTSGVTTANYDVTPITTTKTGALGAVAKAGEYNAVDYDQYGPVIAYYDQTNDTLRIAYGYIASNTAPGVNNWGRQYVIPTTHALHKGSGKHVSIKVDRRNRIHLAFYNSNLQTVVYASAPGRTSATDNGTAGTFTFDTIHTVDNVVQGGTWTDIAVDNYGNPWITYGDTSRNGNYDGIRMAYKSAANDEIRTNAIEFTRPASPAVGTGTNPSIQGWEAVTMPANFTVNNDRLNIEAWPPSNRHNGGTAVAPAGTNNGTGNLGAAPGWNAAIGYGSPNAFRIGYFYVPTYKGDGTNGQSGY